MRRATVLVIQADARNLALASIHAARCYDRLQEAIRTETGTHFYHILEQSMKELVQDVIENDSTRTH